MHYTTFLPYACIHDVLKGIELLVAAATAAMQENPHRPQYADLRVAEMTMPFRPIYARKADRRLFGVFKELPRQGLPCGDRLFVAGIPYMPDCKGKAADGCAEGPGDACCGACRTCIPIEVRIDSRFPLDPVETRWKLGEIFGIDESSIVNTHPSWLTRDHGEEVAQWLPVPHSEHTTPQEGGRCPLEAGKPPCASTLKLEPLVEALPNMRNNKHLKPQWLIWYVEDNGREPTDIDGSFRHAVNTCIKRIERRRSEGGGSRDHHTH